MDALKAHLQQYGLAYIILAVIVLLILWITRRYTFPPIQWGLELVVYSALFHILIHGIVIVTRWFREESQMQAIRDQRIMLSWQTPLEYFWKRELYQPTWLFYFEICMVVLFVFLMIRYRPMKTQKRLPKREVLTKGTGRYASPSRTSIRPKQR